jgi:uncharacterized membrane protein YbaN (DUF454 family)
VNKPPTYFVVLRWLRRPIGLICLIIGILGLILPILPGWPFIIPAIVLLGRKDRTLRLLHLLLRNGLRALQRSRVTWMRQLGMRLRMEYIRGRSMILPAIIKAEQSMPWLS